MERRGALGFSVMRIWRIFCSVFRLWCLVRFAGFPQFSPWYSVFVDNMMTVFRIFPSSVVNGSSGFAKEVTP